MIYCEAFGCHIWRERVTGISWLEPKVNTPTILMLPSQQRIIQPQMLMEPW